MDLNELESAGPPLHPPVQETWPEKAGLGMPSSFVAALGLGAAFFGFVAWDQSHWWRLKEDYTFGWLVPAFVAFVVHDRWPRIVAATQACAASPHATPAGWTKALLRIAVSAALMGGVLLFLLGAFYRAGAGASHPGTLAITLGAAAIVLPLIFLSASLCDATGPGNRSSVVRARSGGLFADPGVRLTALFVFPALVWLVSAPMVSVLENELNLFLLRKVVAVVSFVFDLLGLPIEQQGNVLVLPAGRVGVEDACSGIRSLTACLFAGSFLAAVFLHRTGRKAALIGAALVLAFLTNLLRGLFLTGWAYRYGPDAIGGVVHDIAGYAVLGFTVIGLLCLLPLINLGARERETVPPRQQDRG